MSERIVVRACGAPGCTNVVPQAQVLCEDHGGHLHEPPMTAPSGGRDVLRDEEALATAMEREMGEGQFHPTVPGGVVEQLRRMGWSLAGPDAGAMRRALGDGALTEKDLRWIARAHHGYDRDFACVECRPESDVLVDGFRCTPHKVFAILAALPGPAATGGA